MIRRDAAIRPRGGGGISAGDCASLTFTMGVETLPKYGEHIPAAGRVFSMIVSLLSTTVLTLFLSMSRDVSLLLRNTEF